MKLAVIIATYGRSSLVSRTLAHLEQQTRAPDLVIVSAPDASHLEPFTPSRYPLRAVFGPPGLTKQRNRGLDALSEPFDIVTFFDDDFLPGQDYLAHVERGFAEHPEWAAMMGTVIRDGIMGPGLSFEEGVRLLAQAEAGSPGDRVHSQPSAYGCNMSFRAASIGSLRFDERLVLYGWQEDVDFSRQVAKRGRIVQLESLLGVHLGVKSGRTSGVRFGYSQVVNPIYLMRKGTVPASVALAQMGRNLAANIVKSLRPEPFVDRRGRLRGNIMAAADVLRGRIDPEHVLSL
ncbi:glycosyl transferase [Alsobacter soli]|uniref:Glycosyl transferase n=1 Tax=Alsobacter soli TaxID=2109933 RepID=A0A2T1HQS6_9HYPH|nr:glycosyltransferase [Alsobacter soli]PSC04001.1 glycosyl transferase [Alsobacter soli]